MRGKFEFVILAGVASLLCGTVATGAQAPAAPQVKLAPGDMARVGSVDERFQSFNVEMVEITGGRFWKPYASAVESAPAHPELATPGGIDPSLYQYRPPLDLSNARLRKLAAALGPAYIRVSGTWANSAFFQDSDEPAPAAPPKGYGSVLTRAEWKGVVDFAKAANAQIVTSFAISAGTRDAAGVWTPEQAQAFLNYTESIGGSIAAAEFMNEPTFAAMGGAPQGYSAADYARDFAVFHNFIRAAAPHMIVLGPGGVGEGTSLVPAGMHALATADILAATGPVFDVMSYHSYGAVSSRCGRMGSAATTTEDAALSADWLARSGRMNAYYAGLRDRYEPGKPMWNTETGQAACGGDRWASTFVDTFRYLNQLGTLARNGVQVQMHNTLNASDYGLLDETTYEPRPDYWAALLWRRLMGTTVLDPGTTQSPNLYVYAHCLRGKPGGVAVLAINADRTAVQSLSIPRGAQRYTLTAASLTDSRVMLNGTVLELGAGDALPPLAGDPVHSDSVELAPASITFLGFSRAGNDRCR
jgi:heparanase 1